VAKLTVYIASSGTPLQSGEKPSVGHVWYQIEKGGKTYSFGFAPITSGSPLGPGKIYSNDTQEYTQTKYSRTINISNEQFNDLLSFGTDPSAFGFDMN